jgi:prolyl-tRNA synthetase
MRYSGLFGKTLREEPHGIRSPSYALLLKGGYIRQLGQGLFAYLPLGLRVLRNLERIIGEEMQAMGGQEILAPVVTPAEIWRRSGRRDWIRELVQFRDRSGRELVLSPTHEEAFVEVVRAALSSYRDLPLLLYQFQIKFRDEERTKDGLSRTKEIYMHDGYSFHRSYHELNNFFPRLFKAYRRIFERCGIQTVAAEAGVGYIGGEKSFEFLMPAAIGDHAFIRCGKCQYAASKEVAIGGKEYLRGDMLPLEKTSTPGCDTIDSLVQFLGRPKNRMAKSLLYITPQGPVLAVVRADFEAAPEKLSAYLKVPVYGLAGERELTEAGLLAGSLSPIGLPPDLRPDLRLVVDDAVARSANLVFGANEPGYHFLNGNFGRDFTSEVADISLTRGERICLQCGGRLEEIQAVEVGHIFKLGDYYTRTMNLVFQDDHGRAAYPQMGCWGIGLGRLMDAVAWANRDERGLAWPEAIAPFRAFLMAIGQSLAVKKAAEALAVKLGDEALFDDREDSPGVKFKDADLLGIPLRLVVSTKHLAEGLVEVQERRTGRVSLLAPAQAVRAVQDLAGAKPALGTEG